MHEGEISEAADQQQRVTPCPWVLKPDVPLLPAEQQADRENGAAHEVLVEVLEH